MVHRLATGAGVPMPRLYVIPTDTPNAFATGRNPRNAVVAVTEGIVRLLDHEELEGVLAHELAHVVNRDVLISTIAATLAGAITYLAHMGQWAAMFGRHHDDGVGALDRCAGSGLPRSHLRRRAQRPHVLHRSDGFDAVDRGRAGLVRHPG